MILFCFIFVASLFTFFSSVRFVLTDSLVHSLLLLLCFVFRCLHQCFLFGLFFFTVVDVTKLSERVRPRVRFIKRA